MHNKDLKTEIVHLIKNNKIKPIPKLYFKAGEILIWASFILFYSLGVVVINIHIFLVKNGTDSMESFREFIPFFEELQLFLTIATLLFFGFSFVLLREKRKGFLDSNEKALIYLGLFLIIMSICIYSTGITEYIMEHIIKPVF